MIRTVLFLLGFLLAFDASAVVMRLLPLPASSFADTVVTTNVPMCAAVPSANWKFRFSLDCVPASNSVQVAWGRDTNSNGMLEPEETRLVIGRNRHGVFVENPVSVGRFEQSLPVYGLCSEILSFCVSLDATGHPMRFLAQSEFGSDLFPFWNVEPPSWLFDLDWNLLRVTVRGPGASVEQIRLSLSPDPTILILR